jgi:protein TonB
MGNQLLTPPELEPDITRPAEKEPDFLFETSGSMWSSLISNLRDAFSSSKQPPLQLSSKPVAVEDLEVEESVWKSLGTSLHDVFFPKKLPPLELTSQPLAVEDPTKEEPVWKTLGASVTDIFFPKKLPPLELTSKPVTVVDPMVVKRSPMSSALAVVAHVVVIGLILFFFWAQWRTRAIERKKNLADADVKPFIPMTLKMNQSMGGGGGGGAHELVEASKGHLPKMAKTQIVPPQIIRNDNPKLAAPVAAGCAGLAGRRFRLRLWQWPRRRHRLRQWQWRRSRRRRRIRRRPDASRRRRLCSPSHLLRRS